MYDDHDMDAMPDPFVLADHYRMILQGFEMAVKRTRSKHQRRLLSIHIASADQILAELMEDISTER